MADAILPASGIYAINCSVNGKRYVGQASNIPNRMRMHYGALRRGTHHCANLQRAFAKYGEATFDHAVLEACAPAVLTQREQFWMDHFLEQGLFNSAPAAGSPLGIKRSAETRAKVSASQLGKKVSNETRQRMREGQALAKDLKREKALAQWNKPGAREEASAARKGRVTRESTKRIIGTQSAKRWADPSFREMILAARERAKHRRTPAI